MVRVTVSVVVVRARAMARVMVSAVEVSARVIARVTAKDGGGKSQTLILTQDLRLHPPLTPRPKW